MFIAKSRVESSQRLKRGAGASKLDVCHERPAPLAALDTAVACVPHELHQVLESAAAGFEKVPTALEGAHPAADEGGVRELVEVSVHHVPDLSRWHAVGVHDCDGAWVHQGKATAGEATQLGVWHHVEQADRWSTERTK